MRTTIFLTAIALFANSACFAQVDETINKVDNTINQVNKANETFGKIKGLFPKKKSKTQTATIDSTKVVPKIADSSKAVPGNSGFTILNIAGIDYATLKKLQANIQACEGVAEAKMKFGAEASSIEIKHKGVTDELITLVLLTSKDIFTENDITQLEDGKVSVIVKK